MRNYVSGGHRQKRKYLGLFGLGNVYGRICRVRDHGRNVATARGGTHAYSSIVPADVRGRGQNVEAEMKGLTPRLMRLNLGEGGGRP